MTARHKRRQQAELLQSEGDLASHLERDLVDRYGPVIGGGQLSEVLGYPTLGAFRQSLARGTVPVPVFDIAHRRGRFALTRDIAIWLADRRNTAITDKTKLDDQQ